MDISQIAVIVWISKVSDPTLLNKFPSKLRKFLKYPWQSIHFRLFYIWKHRENVFLSFIFPVLWNLFTYSGHLNFGTYMINRLTLGKKVRPHPSPKRKMTVELFTFHRPQHFLRPPWWLSLVFHVKFVNRRLV